MLSYADLGSGTSTIVFIHGLGSRKEAWIPQHELADDYRLIAVDLRGHGNSYIEGSITIENFAKDVIELLEHLQIEEAYFCGLSLGGIVAQEIYRQNPDIVKGLILANTTSYIPPFAGLFIPFPDVSDKEVLVSQILNRSLHDKRYEDEARNAFLIREEYTKASRVAIGVNYLPTLWRVNKPTLLIGSTNDRTVPLIHQYTMKMYLRNSEMVILDGGHLSSIEQREKFNDAVRDFISRCESK